MDRTYIDIMIQSLEKKVAVLNRIIELNKQQTILLQDPNLSPEEFEKNFQNKSAGIDELNRLDMGFEEVYEHVGEELKCSREKYAAEIARMQELISEISEKTNAVQVQEMRNKERVQTKFADVRKQVRGVRNSQKVVQQYYQTMGKRGISDPRFVDNKK